MKCDDALEKLHGIVCGVFKVKAALLTSGKSDLYNPFWVEGTPPIEVLCSAVCIRGMGRLCNSELPIMTRA